MQPSAAAWRQTLALSPGAFGRQVLQGSEAKHRAALLPEVDSLLETV